MMVELGFHSSGVTTGLFHLELFEPARAFAVAVRLREDFRGFDIVN